MTTDTNFYKPSGSYIEWGTIIGGTVLACAVSTILLQFGAAVGLTQIDSAASADANISPAFVLGTGIFLLWVQTMASLCGGYLAGRMRAPLATATEHEKEMRDGVHGLLVWATSTLAVVVAAGIVAAIAGLTTPAPVSEAAAVADIAVMDEKVALIYAFFAGAISLVSGVLSWWAATVGGDHRDQGTDHSKYFSFRPVR